MEGKREVGKGWRVWGGRGSIEAVIISGAEELLVFLKEQNIVANVLAMSEFILEYESKAGWWAVRLAG